MISRVVGWAATASGFVFVGSLAWFLAGTQGFGLLARQGELCVRFISVPFARCSTTNGWLVAADIGIWAVAVALLAAGLRYMLAPSASRGRSAA